MSRRIVWKSRPGRSQDAAQSTPVTTESSRLLSAVLLNPLYLIVSLAVIQAVVWYFGMPVEPTMPGAWPRFSSELAMLRYVVLFAALICGLVTGQSLRVPGIGPRSDDAAPSRNRVVAFLWAGRFAALLALGGELFYARDIIMHPSIIADAANEGAFANVGLSAAASRVSGVSSFSNIFVAATALFALVAMHPRVPVQYTRVARRWLIGITVFAFLHAMILSARMHFIIQASALLGAYVLARPGVLKPRRLALLVALAVLFVWTGELVRGGSFYAKSHHVSIFHPDTQQRILDLLTQGYIASDFNNAMVILDQPTSMQFFSTTILARALPHPTTYAVPGAFGTINTLAPWWYDCGWWATMVAFAVGYWLGFLYIVARRQIATLGLLTPLYVVSYPGIYTAMRGNYFGGVMFIICTSYLIAFAAVLHFMIRLRAEHAAAMSGAAQ